MENLLEIGKWFFDAIQAGEPLYFSQVHQTKGGRRLYRVYIIAQIGEEKRICNASHLIYDLSEGKIPFNWKHNAIVVPATFGSYLVDTMERFRNYARSRYFPELTFNSKESYTRTKNDLPPCFEEGKQKGGYIFYTLLE